MTEKSEIIHIDKHYRKPITQTRHKLKIQDSK